MLTLFYFRVSSLRIILNLILQTQKTDGRIFSLFNNATRRISFETTSENLRRYILFMSGQNLPSGLRKTMNNLSESFQVSKNFKSEAEIPNAKKKVLSVT